MTRNDTITLYRAPDGWRWRYTASNGRVLADSGQGYSRRVDAVGGACRVAGAGASQIAVVLPDLRKYGEAFIWRSFDDVRVAFEGPDAALAVVRDADAGRVRWCHCADAPWDDARCREGECRESWRDAEEAGR